MAGRGKRWRKLRASIEPTARYTLVDAVDLLKQASNAKFDESVDVAVRLGVDAKQSDQMVQIGRASCRERV